MATENVSSMDTSTTTATESQDKTSDSVQTGALTSKKVKSENVKDKDTSFDIGVPVSRQTMKHKELGPESEDYGIPVKRKKVSIEEESGTVSDKSRSKKSLAELSQGARGDQDLLDILSDVFSATGKHVVFSC